MRISKTEQGALENALKHVKGEVYLYGSRMHNSKKGGDIDILVYSDQSSYYLSKKIAVSFFKYCESKIDVLVVNPNQLTEEEAAFVNTLEKIKLK